MYLKNNVIVKSELENSYFLMNERDLYVKALQTSWYEFLITNYLCLTSSINSMIEYVVEPKFFFSYFYLYFVHIDEFDINLTKTIYYMINCTEIVR